MRAWVKRQSVYRLALTLILASCSIGVLLFLLLRNYSTLRTYDWQLHWAFVIGGIFIPMPGLFLAAVIWADMMQTLHSKITFADHLRYYFMSHLGRRLPGTLWYLAGRSYLYKQQNESLTIPGTASGLELIVTIFSGVLMTLLFIGYVYTQLSRFYILGLIIFGIVGLTGLQPTVIQYVLRRLKAPEIPHLAYRQIIRWLLGYSLIWLMGGVLLFVIANSVILVPLANLPFMISIWCLVGTLSFIVFFLPSNLGFTEVGLSLLLSNIIPSTWAVLIAILARFLIMLYEIITVLIILVGLYSVAYIQRRFSPKALTR